VAELGTLAATGVFSPGDVKNEAELLDNATRALGRLIFNHIELFSQDFLVGWNSYVEDVREFWGRANSFTWWVDFADNAARDEVLALERRYTPMLGKVNDVVTGRIEADDVSTLDPFSDPYERKPQELFPIVKQEAKSLVDDLTSIGWDVIIAGAVVLAVGVAAAVILLKSAGFKIALPGGSVG
jgi:hypothetical protein